MRMQCVLVATTLLHIGAKFHSFLYTSSKTVHVNTLRTGDADLRLYAYKQFKYPVPNVLTWSLVMVVCQ
jgi:hypothetical protein